MESIAEVSPWLPWCHAGYSIAETESFIESCITAWTQQSHFPLAIFEASTGLHLGDTKGRGEVIASGVPIRCAGVQVNPGDYVIGGNSF